MRESWLPARPESGTRAGAIVREASVERGLDKHGPWSLKLATTEAVSNAILAGALAAERDRRALGSR